MTKLYMVHTTHNPDVEQYAQEGAYFLKASLERDIPEAFWISNHIFSYVTDKPAFQPYIDTLNEMGLYTKEDVIVRAGLLGQPKAAQILMQSIKYQHDKSNQDMHYALYSMGHDISEELMDKLHQMVRNSYDVTSDIDKRQKKIVEEVRKMSAFRTENRFRVVPA